MERMDKALVYNNLIHSVVGKEATQILEDMDKVVSEHEKRYGERVFLLNGTPYFSRKEDLVQRSRRQLDPDLVPDALAVIKRQDKLKLDLQRLKNFYGTFQHECVTAQDFRDVLPDLVVQFMSIDEIKRLERTRVAGYVFEQSPAKMKRFQYGVDICLHYLASEFL